MKRRTTKSNISCPSRSPSQCTLQVSGTKQVENLIKVPWCGIHEWMSLEQWFPKWAVRSSRGAVKQIWAVGGR